MSKSRPCDDCGNNIPQSLSLCPHCGRPSLPPNVAAASDANEFEALEKRYVKAKADSKAVGTLGSVDNFETAVSSSVAVMARSLNELQRLAKSDNELYATYYDLIEAGVRVPDGEKWDVVRVVADSALFPGYKEQIKFAALSMDGIGLKNYGECSIVLRTDMIAHRATVFEENSVLFMKRHNVRISDADQLLPGYRATWNNRGMLCVAKLHSMIDPTADPARYSAILLRSGRTSEEDEFVEVHVWGPMTVRTMERVSIIGPNRRAKRAIMNALKEGLARAGVGLEP